MPQSTQSKPEPVSEYLPTGKPVEVLERFFPDFLWRNKWNRGYLLFALAAFLAEFIVFKFWYPYANYMPDSYSYLQAAASNVDVNMWPVAYSKFLRLVSVFTHSDTVVVSFQYFLTQIGALVFLFTLLYFLRPRNTVKNFLFAFFLFNPITLFTANYISADAVFIGLSFFWVSVLLWIIFRPNHWQIVVQAILLLACFTVRYNAIYYPIVAGFAFLISRQHWHGKVSGIVLGSALVFLSVFYTSNKMQQVTGKRQFSAFGGWQLANNALYMYRDIPAVDRKPLPARFAKLERMVLEHIDTLKQVKFTKNDTVNSYFYLWSDRGPLIQYMNRQWKKDSTTPYFKQWASEGPLYKDYAVSLIRRYPVQFAKTFLLPNALKYAVPPIEFLGTYNMGSDSVGNLPREWFGYRSQRVVHGPNKLTWLRIYPVTVAIINIIFWGSLIGFTFLGGIQNATDKLKMFILLLTAFSLSNIVFSISASPIVLRYQLFPMILLFTIGVLLVEFIYNADVNSGHLVSKNSPNYQY